MNIIQISDCHLFADKEKVGYNHINPYQSLQTILLEISAYKIDMLLVTGDLSGDASEASYQHFEQLFAASNLECELRILPGNHDSIQHLLIVFSEGMLWLNSPLEFCNIHWKVHLLNTQFQGTLGNISKKELDELQQQLQNDADTYHVIAVHHHPIDCNGWMDKHEWVNRQDFTQLVESFPNVKLVVYGHIHSDIETLQNGVLYLACPSTCWQWANTESFGVSDLKPGFRVIELDDNAQFNHVIKRIN
ncbi:metallophosphoesterase [Paraglaciecola marina]|uniref:metallophosphoesterase n=1 Tax=Paraglaciecola marina TaxID=2500157 RepID=UPI00105B741E|nr:metallophosphoesterase [Paraglaciecola marina]